MNEDIQREIRKKISEIEEKSADGAYIYRGEPETHEGPPYYGKVSSSLWREHRLELEYFNIRLIEQEMLKTAKKHTGHPQQNLVADLPTVWGMYRGEGAEKPRLASVDLAKVWEKYPSETEFELLTEIQHYGGKTNLIDFTTDYLIALFFACDGHHDKDGRVILQETEEIKDMINHPRNPQHRVIAQKSVFVHPTEGFIEPHEKDIVIISANLKQPLLEHLRKYHSVSTETIYNDIYGFIRNQSIHRNAYTEFYRGFACQKRGDEATTSEKKQKWYEEAVKHYTQATRLNPDNVNAYYNRGNAHSNLRDYKSAFDDYTYAIEHKPDFADAYNNRGMVYFRQGELKRALDDYTHAIEIDPNLANAYCNRGEIWLHLEEWEKAKSDLTTAKEKSVDIINAFRNEYESVAAFKEKYGIQLPADIAKMLTPTQN